MTAVIDCTEGPKPRADWEADCLRWRGEVLNGKYAHWCCEWDGLPVDETTREFASCGCWEGDATPEQLVALRAAQQTAQDVDDAFQLGFAGLGE